MHLLVPSESGRRALEETLADWRDSRARANGRARLWCEVQGVASVVRVLAGISSQEMTTGAPLLRAVITLAATILLVAIVLMWQLRAPDVSLLLVPGVVVFALPFTASLCFGSRRGDAPSLLGYLLFLMIFQAAMVNWIAPRTTGLAIERLIERDVRPGWRQSHQSSEVLPPAESGAKAALLRWTRTLPLVLVIPAFTIMGAAVRRRLQQRAFWIRQVACTALVLMVLVAATLLSIYLWRSLLGCLVVTLAAVVAFVIAGRTRLAPQVTVNPD